MAKSSSAVIRTGSRKAVFIVRDRSPAVGETFALIDEHGFGGVATITNEDCGPRFGRLGGQCFDDCPRLVCAELAEPSRRDFAPFGVGPFAHPLSYEKARARGHGCASVLQTCKRPIDAAGWTKEASIDLDGDSRSDIEMFSRDCGPFAGWVRYAFETRVRKGDNWHVTERVNIID